MGEKFLRGWGKGVGGWGFVLGELMGRGVGAFERVGKIEFERSKIKRDWNATRICKF